jgi:hypothetical protein
MAVFGSIVRKMATLAKRGQIMRFIICRVVVEMGTCEDNTCLTDVVKCWICLYAPSLSVAPLSILFIPPTAVTKMPDAFQMGSTAALAAPLCASKAN